MNFDSPHRRYNSLTGEWVLVSPHRAKRPWLGQVEEIPPENLPAFDPDCYLCPGNARAGGKKNPVYTSTFVFDNDFAALLPPSQAPGGERQGQPEAAQTPGRGTQPLSMAQPAAGLCRVVCFSPRHDLTLPEMSVEEVEAVIRTWSQQTEELGSLDWVQYVQVFENKGEMMGASNPHPHSQIWSSDYIPNEPAKELMRQHDYLRQHGACLLCDYLELEREAGTRIVVENEHFVALAPFWAVWPFELMLVSRRHLHSLPQLNSEEVTSLAEIMRSITARYDNLFEISFPYSMGFHQAPSDRQQHSEWHFHAHYYPPLLRSATVRKFMVGYEMLAMPQRDLTPETAAQRLRDMQEIHYRFR